jgi:pyruvate-formate lyase
MTSAGTAMKTMKLAKFMLDNSNEIISEWEDFARAYVPAAGNLDRKGRRDHVAGMLEKIAKDLEKPQTKGQQASNPKYVVELLTQMSSDQVTIALGGELDPGLLRPLTGDDYLGVVMPMRI